ncbi:Ubiquitin-associated/translation elongation factor EF1B, N-terminal, eukaryote [Plasmopara halstedii]|uniref:Ubiquitin-associated/translation elongation factor EF1B, N-terminal, eukaryote n=1 Tax=Plasmopara halstedii TaxID=4781 RepID=A0A0P1AHW8_PLAHL|nr:Ubiquitin-associated/translation elongation factor EF1B, N-terminal, eukaryote [Plasmopara halstedii]CEG40278.1 Ubiquitin-associated/translation elongation factor EF1B, N-terminal, eukaryote [Plasmopara halstedii]|eukprot:XP_024576647.1 Ubiquitin-associated/translation elongation factor EF1B, N-terminal, eukaryote [Plasmopara halstedii]
MEGSLPHRQLHVLLTLLDGEHSFGMSLAQKCSVLGLKYTVVSSVFANSPADRAGVRKGYVLRSVNDTPVGGLTVAQVANYFRNVGQTRITLEIVGKPTFTSKTTTCSRVEQLLKLPGAAPSGRAIAAPGSALVVPRDALTQQSMPRRPVKSAAKALALQRHSDEIYSAAACVPDRADPKYDSTGRIHRIGLQAIDVNPNKAEEKALVSVIDVELTSECMASKPSSLHPTLLQKSDLANVASQERVVADVQLEISVPSTDFLHASLSATSRPPIKTSSNCEAPTSDAKRPSTLLISHSARSNDTALMAPSENAASKTTDHFLPSLTAKPLTNPQRKPTISLGETVVPSTLEMDSNSPRLESLSSIPCKIELVSPAVHRPTLAIESLNKPSISPRQVAIMPSAAMGRDAASTSEKLTVAEAALDAAQPHSSVKKCIKRRRSRKHSVASNDSIDDKASKKTKTLYLSDERDDISSSDETVEPDAFSSDSDENIPSPKSDLRKVRRCDRPRNSLTIDRLIGMGFARVDAEASVEKFGNDPDACMVWIISKIEERQFNEDLNRASIQSEQSKREEEKRVKTLEKEKLACSTKFMAVFPTSYMICSESSALNLKTLLQSTIDQIHGKAYIRDILTQLLTLEGKSIRWYKEAARSYMLELANRLDIELRSHDVVACCAQNVTKSRDNLCTFVRKVVEEVETLTKALYEMPTNQGGVPPVFLECDETTKFDLENDGFEVIE